MKENVKMGYCISMRESVFYIGADNKNKARDDVREYVKENNPNWAWINDNKTLLKSPTLEGILSEFGYEPTIDDDGNITDIDFWSEKMGDEEKLFEIIAPYVKDGYIEMNGEEGCFWRWVFKGGKFYTVDPEVTWPNE